MALIVLFPGGGCAGCGDVVRRELQDDIVAALESGKWASVEASFNNLDIAQHSALLIGDARGTQWETTRGWVSLDKEYAIASESKMIAALTVWRVMRHTSLTLDSSPGDYFDSWATSKPAVTLEHLLSFTTGFRGSDEDSCAAPGGRGSWEECVDELAGLPREAVAGESFKYGSKHLVVACAMAQKALSRPLTTAAWKQTVAEELFEPAGLGVSADYVSVCGEPRILAGLCFSLDLHV